MSREEVLGDEAGKYSKIAIVVGVVSWQVLKFCSKCFADISVNLHNNEVDITPILYIVILSQSHNFSSD